MNVFFMGATKFSQKCLGAVLQSGQRVVGCASTPETFQISYSPSGVKNINYADFSMIAKELGVPCIPYERGRRATSLARWVLWSPTSSWRQAGTRQLRDVAPRGAIGLHSRRGGSPLVWSIINGEKEGGVTLFYLDDGVDTGDIIGQTAFPISRDDTIATALVKLDEAAVQLLVRYLPQRSPADGQIDWAKPVDQIHDFIRAQTRPYPGAFTRMGNKKVILWDADVLEEEVEIHDD